MKNYLDGRLTILPAVGLVCAAIACSMPTFAQTTNDEGQFISLDEVIVTGRKREESLQDIPVTISVIGGNDLAELNVLRQDDLAALVPGYHYNQGVGLNEDRTAALPSIRGIGSTEIFTNRAKVATFIDGMPVLGSIGAINIGGSTQVEVYSGPQSAAFGRSTFAGAINYVTRDPGDTLEGTAGINWSNDGTRIVSGSFGGPITDTLGFQVTAQLEDSSSPDTDLYSYTDGVEATAETGENFSARLVFTPSDKFKAKFTFSRDTTDDGPRADFYSGSQDSFDCFNNTEMFAATVLMVGMAMLGNVVDGVWECELEPHADAVLEQLNDYGRYFDANPDVLDDIINNGYDNGDPAGDYVPTASLVSQGAVDGYLGLTLEEQVRIVYDGFSVEHGASGAESERNRITGQFDYLLDNGSAWQLSLMRTEEDIFRGYSRIAEQEVAALYWDNANQYYTQYSNPDWLSPMSMAMQNGRRAPDNDPTAIEETYAEFRWASPEEERLRYVLGASYYDYEYAAINYDAPGYNNLAAGTADLFAQLINPSELTRSGGVVAPTRITTELTTNTAVFFNASYDFTNTITGSIEGRYAQDDVGAFLPLEGLEQAITTKTFTPRIALNYAPNDSTTYYLQYSEGVNPAGINATMLDPALRDTLDNGVPVDDTVYGGTVDGNITTVNYTSDRYASFGEEKLTNFEFGFKGNAFDGRFTYAGALYFMVWEDALESIALNWDYLYADDDCDGMSVFACDGTGPTDVYYVQETDFTSTGQILTNTGESETTGIELQTSYQISENWSVSANASFMERKFTDYCSEDDFIGFADELGVLVGLTEGISEGGNPCWELNGLDVSDQPGFSMTVIPRYRTEFGDGFRFSGSATFRHTAQHFAEYSNTTENPAVDRVNLNLGISKDSWSASLYVTNLLDNKKLVPRRFTSVSRFTDLNTPAAIAPEHQQVGPDGGTYGSFSILPNEGRTFGVRLNYDF